MEFFTEIFATGQVSTANTADLTPPVIFTPSANVTSGTTITGEVATNEANGTLYAYVGQTPSTPSTTSVIAGIGAEAHISMVITSTGAKVFNFTGLTGSTVYYVYYLHRDLAGNNSVIVSVGPVMTNVSAPPPASTGITYVFPAHIDESTTETGFRAYLQNLTDAGARTLAATIPALAGTGSAINYTAGSLVANKLYSGEIVSFNSSGESSLTYGPFQFRTAPAGVPALTATAIDHTQVNLAWTALADPISGVWEIYRNDVLISESVLASARVYSDTGRTGSTAYAYKVRARNNSPTIGGVVQPAAFGSYSNVSNATTSVAPAAPFTWDTATTVNDDTDVNTEGVLVTGKNFGRIDHRTWNGVLFDPVTSFGELATTFAPGWPYGGLSIDGDLVMGSGCYVFNATATITVVTGLIIGNNYLLQLFISHPGQTPTQIHTVNGVSSPAINRGTPTSLIGRWTATATSLSLTLTGSTAFVELNGLQVRNVTP